MTRNKKIAARDRAPAAKSIRTRVAASLRAVTAALVHFLPFSAAAQTIETYHGPCDASAAIAIDSDRFVVANDENNVLRFYRRGVPEPEGTLDLSKFLRAGEEADIEAAAAIGSRVYWITSHGRDSKGKRRPTRLRFFATDIRPGQPPTLIPVGHPYTGLLNDLTKARSLRAFDFAGAAKLAAEADGGLNIEGLAATPDGKLLIGFRNPLHDGRALIVPLENPAKIVEGERARFGAPIELALRKRGIRTFHLVGSGYLIVAGPTGDEGKFSLYRWSGNGGDRAVEMKVDLGSLKPEALFAIPGSNQVQLLSDDGGEKVAGKECKSLPPDEQRFRSLTVVLPKR